MPEGSSTGDTRSGDPDSKGALWRTVKGLLFRRDEHDQSLRAQDPAWGIRRREDVELEAAKAGLQLSARHAMPANNLLLVWKLAA